MPIVFYMITGDVSRAGRLGGVDTVARDCPAACASCGRSCRRIAGSEAVRQHRWRTPVAKPRPVTAAEAMSRINAALASMKRAGPVTSTRASKTVDRPAPPRYRLRWPALEPRWRLVWPDEDRVTLTWR